jgi:hypothetical protein
VDVCKFVELNFHADTDVNVFVMSETGTMEKCCVLSLVRGEEKLINFLTFKAHCRAALCLGLDKPAYLFNKIHSTMKDVIQKSLFC